MNITQRVGREIKRQIRRVTRQVMGMTDGWDSDDSNEEATKNYADVAQSTRRPRSEEGSRAPSPELLTRRPSLPDLRVIENSQQVDVNKIRAPLGEVRVWRARAPEPRRTEGWTSVGRPGDVRSTMFANEGRRSVEPPDDVRTTKFARDRNDNWANNKMDLAVAGWDIKPRYRLVEPRPRVSITQCCDNISNVVTQRKSSG